MSDLTPDPLEEIMRVCTETRRRMNTYTAEQRARLETEARKIIAEARPESLGARMRRMFAETTPEELAEINKTVTEIIERAQIETAKNIARANAALKRESACCDDERRGFDGRCLNCGDPCL